MICMRENASARAAKLIGMSLARWVQANRVRLEMMFAATAMVAVPPLEQEGDVGGLVRMPGKRRHGGIGELP